MTIQQTNNTKISRRAVFGGGAAAIALASLTSTASASVPGAKDGAPILTLFHQLSAAIKNWSGASDQYYGCSDPIEKDRWRKLEETYATEMDQVSDAIAEFQCTCIEDALYQMAYFIHTDAQLGDTATDLCGFQGSEEQFTRAMKYIARFNGITPVDTVDQILGRSSRPLGY